MNVYEYGIAFVFSTGFDMSGYSGIAIHFTKPDGTTLQVSNPDVTVPSVDIATTLGTFLANKYAQYIFKAGDVDQVGNWTARVIYDDVNPTHLISDIGNFIVNP
jgi:hypothetical protein